MKQMEKGILYSKNENDAKKIEYFCICKTSYIWNGSKRCHSDYICARIKQDKASQKINKQSEIWQKEGGIDEKENSFYSCGINSRNSDYPSFCLADMLVRKLNACLIRPLGRCIMSIQPSMIPIQDVIVLWYGTAIRRKDK